MDIYIRSEDTAVHRIFGSSVFYITLKRKIKGRKKSCASSLSLSLSLTFLHLLGFLFPSYYRTMQPAGTGMVPPPPMDPQQQPPHAQFHQQYQQQAPPNPYMMMPPQQPPQMWGPQQPPQPLPPAPSSSALPGQPDEVRTLWIGDLQYWMDENYLASCFASTGEVHGLSLPLLLLF